MNESSVIFHFTGPGFLPAIFSNRIMPSMSAKVKKNLKTMVAPILLTAVCLVLIGVWILFSPPGLDGKIKSIGYAICHQIGSHSLFYGSHQLPLCARCTGLFMGALIGSSILSRKNRCGKLPSGKYVFLLAIPVIAFLIDGVNSTLFFIDNWKGFYAPNNTLRLFTGLGMGLVLANLFVPLWNQILWSDWINQSPLNFCSLIYEVFAGLFCGLMLLSGISWLYFPVAVLSTLTVVGMLSAVYTLLWTLGLKNENSYAGMKNAKNMLLLGFITAAVQLEGMALIRFAVTHTWSGFSL